MFILYLQLWGVALLLTGAQTSLDNFDPISMIKTNKRIMAMIRVRASSKTHALLTN
ncbi:hypothetical protein M758_2G176300 [Ceratodon purpureus]|nr:hypothetical protein M758_2G176300 [Ceratodon purpureus]